MHLMFFCIHADASEDAVQKYKLQASIITCPGPGLGLNFESQGCSPCKTSPGGYPMWLQCCVCVSVSVCVCVCVCVCVV